MNLPRCFVNLSNLWGLKPTCRLGMRVKVGAQTRLGLKKRLMIHKSKLSLLAKRTSIDERVFDETAK